jgi:hypothetical protein
MGWSLGFDNKWNRDVGYGVPAICDHPKCNEEIDRGLSFVCGGEPYGGEHGCGLYFCANHLYFHSFRDGETHEVCNRCDRYKSSYKAKPDSKVWIRFKLKDKSWEQWRQENPKEVEKMKLLLTHH